MYFVRGNPGQIGNPREIRDGKSGTDLFLTQSMAAGKVHSVDQVDLYDGTGGEDLAAARKQDDG